MMWLICIIFNMTCALQLYDNGILLEETGKLYLSHGKVTFDVFVERPIPIEAFSNLEYKDCLCYFTEKFNKTSCKTTARNLFVNHIRKAYNKTILNLHEETERLGYRSRRAPSPSILMGLLNFGWNAYQEREIYNLRHIALDNSYSIIKLATEMKNFNNALIVQNKKMYENFHKLDIEICERSMSSWEDLMMTKAELTIQNYLVEVEHEVISFMEGSIPKRLEYIHLYTGLCIKSCHQINMFQCQTYCKRMMQRLPVDMAPILRRVEVHESGLVIVFSITLPSLTLEPKTLYRTKPFGIILTMNDTTVKRTPVVTKYAAQITNNTTLEIDESNCQMGRRDLVCDQNAMRINSCLRKPEHCQYNWEVSDQHCTVAYATAGVAIYSLNTVAVHNPVTLKEVGNERNKWQGMMFIPCEEDELKVNCNLHEVITIPAVIKPINISVTITSYEYAPITFNHSQANIQLATFKLDINKNLDSIIQIQKESHKASHLNDWLIIVALVTAIGFGAIVTIVIYRKFNSRNFGFQQELNRLRPVA